MCIIKHTLFNQVYLFRGRCSRWWSMNQCLGKKKELFFSSLIILGTNKQTNKHKSSKSSKCSMNLKKLKSNCSTGLFTFPNYWRLIDCYRCRMFRIYSKQKLCVCAFSLKLFSHFVLSETKQGWIEKMPRKTDLITSDSDSTRRR